ncbi:hypothetical protein AO501_33905 [Mycobacterium gordonae]|uniref:Uncharacterized protein n=1 Tax=Mycobacterium gordonae TaxID=1778 RepID=A0A0Q2XFK9_MYCGO|nr:hypothetical protein AO501_33905 [Mycobacterium gordonae]
MRQFADRGRKVKAVASDTAMARLRGRHAREIDRLFREFLKLHPTIDPHLSDGLWMTDEQDAVWRAFTADEDARFKRERAALAAQLRAERARE